MRIVRCPGARSLVVLVLLVAFCGTAWADNVGRLIEQLGHSSEKIRFAAAVNLAKTEDERGILPLARVLLNDPDKNVRGAAAVGLGRIISAHPKSKYKSLAMKNIARAAKSDSSPFVKQQAAAALKTIGGSAGSSGGGSSSGGAGGIYVNIGPMSSKTKGGKNDKLRALMVKTAQKTLAKVASSMATTWPGGTPNKAALAKKGVAGFYVDGTLNTLDIKVSGGGATISCKVSMLLADFPDKSVFGFLNGGASVTASSSKTDQDLASEDCVMAVIENLIANKIVPTIKAKAQ